MTSRCYRIGAKVLVPLVLLLVGLVALLVVSVNHGEARAKIIILIGIFLPVVILLVTNLRRRVELNETGVRVQRPFSEKSFRWDELTSLEAVAVRGRALVTICAGEEFAILSNNYGNFTGLVQDLIDHLPASAVTPEARQLVEQPVSAIAGVLPLWFGVLALGYILWHQLIGP